MNSDSCKEVTTAAVAATATAQAAMGAGVAVGGAVSMLSMSSPQAIWMMVNQLQLLMLMPLTKAYIPTSIVHYLTGMSFMNFNFDIIPFKKFPVTSNMFDFLDFENDDEYLKEIGVKWGSTLLNNFILVLMFLVLVFIHLLLILINKIIRNKDKEAKQKCIQKVVAKLVEIFTFGIYLRTFLEAFQVIMLSSIRELKRFDNKGSHKKFSFALACIFLFLCAFMLSLIFEEWLRSRKRHVFLRQRYCKEFFGGIKDRWLARSYLLFSYLRRTLLIVIVMSEIESMIATVTCFCTIQLAHCCFVFYLRPFEKTQNNLVELVNEAFFAVLSCCLLYLNVEPRWKHIIELLYMGAISLNTVIVSIILLVSLILHIKKRGIKCKKNQDCRLSQRSNNDVRDNTSGIEASRPGNTSQIELVSSPKEPVVEEPKEIEEFKDDEDEGFEEPPQQSDIHLFDIDQEEKDMQVQVMDTEKINEIL